MTETETQTEVVETGEYVLNVAATDVEGLNDTLTETDLPYQTERGDRVAITYATAASGYDNTKTVEGRILEVKTGYRTATLKVATRDGVRVVREDYENEATVVCSINKHGNERVIGNFVDAGFDGRISLLRPEMEQREVATDGGVDDDEEEHDEPTTFKGQAGPKLRDGFGGCEFSDADAAKIDEKTAISASAVRRFEGALRNSTRDTDDEKVVGVTVPSWFGRKNDEIDHQYRGLWTFYGVKVAESDKAICVRLFKNGQQLGEDGTNVIASEVAYGDERVANEVWIPKSVSAVVEVDHYGAKVPVRTDDDDDDDDSGFGEDVRGDDDDDSEEGDDSDEEAADEEPVGVVGDTADGNETPAMRALEACKSKDMCDVGEGFGEAVSGRTVRVEYRGDEGDEVLEGTAIYGGEMIILSTDATTPDALVVAKNAEQYAGYVYQKGERVGSKAVVKPAD